MPLLQLTNIHYTFGGRELLDGVDLILEKGERVALLGPNGSGKSTLLRIAAGLLLPDTGARAVEPGLRFAMLPQEVPAVQEGNIQHVVERIVCQCAKTEELATEDVQRIRETLSRMHLDSSLPFSTLSGGMRRRVWIAGVLAAAPDVLLLDEPTNHLDTEAILQFETVLLRNACTLLFVTHDRAFLERIGNRFLDLDRGRLISYPGNWRIYRERRDAFLAAEEERLAKFDKKLQLEEEWLRRGVKARRTRNEGRVKRLLEMRAERRAVRERQGSIEMRVELARQSGKLVLEASHVSFSYGETPVIRDFSTVISRGDRIGVVGPNGCGKTTLLRLLFGHIPLQSGRIRYGAHLQVVFFDQLREQLDPQRTLRETVADGRDFLDVGDRRRHVTGWLQDFLFHSSQFDTPVGVLSGGERNRLMLARLFARPSNVLVMDEPTNDLDMDTLEVLEHCIDEYPGTILLVSHDRVFLDDVVTSIWRFEGDGNIMEYVGGWSDLPPMQVEKSQHRERPVSSDARPTASILKRPRRRTFAETRELATMEARIADLEEEKSQLIKQLSDPEFYRHQAAQAALVSRRLQEIETELTMAWERWEYLESLPS